MSEGVITERVTADIDGEFVVFRIGMRINTLWKVHKWVPVFLAMPRLLRELEADPDSGLLGYQWNLGIRNHMLFMYWRSFEDLREYDATRAGNTCRPGESTTRRPGVVGMSGSGTRRSSSGLESTRPSTTICRRSASGTSRSGYLPPDGVRPQASDSVEPTTTRCQRL